MPLNVTVEPRVTPTGATVTVLRLAGSLDTHTVPEARRVTAPVLAGGTQTVVLNMSDLEFIDSSGVSFILSTRADLTKAKRVVLMTNLQKQIRRVFEIVKAIPDLSIFESTAELDAYLAKIQKAELE